jgi:hypothetical protein
MEHIATHPSVQVTSGTTGNNGGLLLLLAQFKQEEQNLTQISTLGSPSTRLSTAAFTRA